MSKDEFVKILRECGYNEEGIEKLWRDRPVDTIDALDANALSEKAARKARDPRFEIFLKKSSK